MNKTRRISLYLKFFSGTLSTCTSHCNKLSRSRFHYCLPFDLLGSDKIGLGSLQCLFWKQAYQIVIIPFFQRIITEKKMMQRTIRNFNYKISLCLWINFSGETETAFFLQISLISGSVVPYHFWHQAKPVQTCTHTCIHDQYIQRHTHTYIYLEGQ